jgi:Tfp pilus assembly protein PilZ
MAVRVETVSGQVVEVRSRDISQGGIFLISDQVLPVGTEVSLALELPGHGPCKIPGYVRWLKADGFGVQFGLLGARETHAIGKVVRTAQAS